MRKTLVHGFAAAAALALVAAPASAQSGVTFGVGGGLSIPLADFADEDAGGAETGYHGAAHVGFQGGANLPVGFRIDGMYQRYSLSADALGSDDFDVNYQLLSGSANVVYAFATSEQTRFRPYLIGGGGIYNLDVKGDDADDLGFEGDATKFGINAGAGFNFAFGNVGLFLEGRFHNVFTEGENTSFVPITLGLRFGGNAPE